LYQPLSPRGAAIVQLLDPPSVSLAPRIAQALQDTLPARRVVIARGQAFMCPEEKSGSCPFFGLEPPADRLCPNAGGAGAPGTMASQAGPPSTDPRCTHEPRGITSYLSSGLLVDDGAALPSLTGVPASRAVAALHAGKVVVFDPWLVERGIVIVIAATRDGKQKRYRLPAVALTEGFPIAQMVLPAGVAHRLGVHPSPVAVYADDGEMPSDRQEQAAQGALDLLRPNLTLRIERGYADNYSVMLLALVLGAAVITIGAAGIATALSNVDGRQDLTTLAAVGASPRVRRLLSMSRAGVIAVLGTVLGTLAGFVPSVGLIFVQRAMDRFPTSRPLAVSWPSLIVTAVVAPLIAIAVAGLFSRSRLPVERRAAT